MTKKMSKEEKRITELVRRRMKKSRSTELLIRRGKRARGTGHFPAGREAKPQTDSWRGSRWNFGGARGYHSGDRGLYGNTQGDGDRYRGAKHQLPGAGAGRTHQGGRTRVACRKKFCCDRVRNIQRGRVAGRKGAAHLRSDCRAFPLQVEGFRGLTRRRPEPILRHPCGRT